MTILVGLSVCVSSVSLALSVLFAFLYVSPMDASRSNTSPTLVQLQTSSSQRALAMKRRDKAQNRSEVGRRREDVRRGDLTRTTLHDTIRAYNRRRIVVSISSYKRHILLLQDRSRQDAKPHKILRLFRRLYISVEQNVVRILVKNVTPGLSCSGARRNRSPLGSPKIFLACTFDATWLLKQVHLRIHYCKFFQGFCTFSAGSILNHSPLEMMITKASAKDHHDQLGIQAEVSKDNIFPRFCNGLECNNRAHSLSSFSLDAKTRGFCIFRIVSFQGFFCNGNRGYVVCSLPSS